MGNPRGFGEADAKLADDLDKAKSKQEADGIARADGHCDAADAADWLAGRSDHD